MQSTIFIFMLQQASSWGLNISYSSGRFFFHLQLISVFKFLIKQMTEQQFLISVTANYYSSAFYCSSVWHACITETYRSKLTSLHFRLLRIACKDYNVTFSRDQLTERCLRATPNEWSKYTTASLAMKVVRDKCPQRLHDLLMETFYTERRTRGNVLFYDKSRSLLGRQSVQNRLKYIHEKYLNWYRCCQMWL